MTPEAGTLIPERLKVAMDAPLLAGGHNAPPSDDAQPEACLLEMVAWAYGESWSDHPDCVSSVLGNFGRRLNDRLPDAERQRLKDFIPRLGGTAGDGQDAARRALAAKWVINTGLPQWLELIGMTTRADELRTMEVTQWDSALSDLLWKVRDEVRMETGVTWVGFRQTIRVEVRKRLEAKGTPAAVAAAAADAVAAAVAAAVADAVADAVAAAVAAAVADAVADLSPDARWQKVYNAVRNSDEVKAAIDKAIPFAEEHREAAFVLFEQMIDPSAAE